jgi:hypothetical protein
MCADRVGLSNGDGFVRGSRNVIASTLRAFRHLDPGRGENGRSVAKDWRGMLVLSLAHMGKSHMAFEIEDFILPLLRTG